MINCDKFYLVHKLIINEVNSVSNFQNRKMIL